MVVLLPLWLALAAPPAPVALVLQANVGAMLRRGDGPPRALQDLDLLLPGDRIQAGEVAVRLVVLSDGHGEQLTPGKRTTVRESGCEDTDSITREASKLKPANLERLRTLARSNRAGVEVVRGSGGTPLPNSTIFDPRPTLSWPANPAAVEYEVNLIVNGKFGWQRVSDKPSSKFPDKESDLPPGAKCSLKVTPRSRSGKLLSVLEWDFRLADEAHQTLPAILEPLTTGNDPAFWLLAARTYEAHGAYAEAMALYEKTAQKRPGQANIFRLLANYYRLAGLPDKEKAARRQAEDNDKSDPKK